jgi:hypothetical protein
MADNENPFPFCDDVDTLIYLPNGALELSPK